MDKFRVIPNFIEQFCKTSLCPFCKIPIECAETYQKHKYAKQYQYDEAEYSCVVDCINDDYCMLIVWNSDKDIFIITKQFDFIDGNKHYIITFAIETNNTNCIIIDLFDDGSEVLNSEKYFDLQSSLFDMNKISKKYLAQTINTALLLM